MDEKDVSLKAENEAVIEEIKRYKWIESEKAGYDIGINRAFSEWIERHYENWKKDWIHNRERKKKANGY